MKGKTPESPRPRIGVLGGTFDPIHNAHLVMAEAAIARLGLDEVHFLVSNTPPHKIGRALTPAWHRFAMVALATVGRPEWLPCALELETPGPSYTIDALQRFCVHRGCPAEAILFLAGGDSLRDFHQWKAADRLLREFRFLFVMRPGVPPGPEAAAEIGAGRIADGRGQPDAALREILNHPGVSLLADLGTPDISSTRIRHVLESGHDCAGQVPAPVWDYIRKLNLYGGQ
jgi:nicotinate-nucleotide adenylyltransferase